MLSKLRPEESNKSADSAPIDGGLLHRPPMPQTHRCAHLLPVPDNRSDERICSTDGTNEYRTKPTLGDKIAGPYCQPAF